MKKLLEFDFSIAIDGAVKDEAAKIRVAEDKVSDERTVKCKSGCCPLTICCLPYGKIGMAGSHSARLAQL
ncbi:unnamed protein product [Malus baccata var. baccata]